MDSAVYERVLIENYIPFMEREDTGRDFEFQQDNARIHTSKRMKEFFYREGMTVMNWPAKLPDRNVTL